MAPRGRRIDFGLAAALNMVFVYKYIGDRLPLLLMMKIACAALAMGGAAVVVYYMALSLTGNAAAVLLAIVGAVIVYGGALLLTKALEKEDIYHLPFIGKRLRRKENA